MSHIAPCFADSSRWIRDGDAIVYAPQNHSYKEVLLGGTPIEWFCVDNDVPTILAPIPAKHRPRQRRRTRDDVDTDTDTTHIISNDGWYSLDSKQINQLPWMLFHRDNPYSRLCFNRERTHYTVNTITSSGEIWFDQCTTPAYILKNYRRQTQLKLVVNMRPTQLDSVTCELTDSTHYTYMYDIDGTCEMYVDMPRWRNYDRDDDVWLTLYDDDGYDYDYEWD